MSYEIREVTRYRFLKPRRVIEGEPTHEALRAWRDEENVSAPSVEWLKVALDDALNRIAELEGRDG
jgi:DNA gyrase inhibitor GyrI